MKAERKYRKAEQVNEDRIKKKQEQTMPEWIN